MQAHQVEGEDKGKFVLTHLGGGQSVKLKADSQPDADTWMTKLRTAAIKVCRSNPHTENIWLGNECYILVHPEHQN